MKDLIHAFVVNPISLGGGSSNIGNVDVASIAAGDNNIGNVDVLSIAAGETHVGEVGGHSVTVAVEITRPGDTTPYSAGDCVSDSTSTTTVQNVANFARVSDGTGYITGVRITTDKKSITPRIRVHLYNVNTPTVSADNALWKDLYADEGKSLGYIDLPAMITGTDAANSTMSYSQDMTLRHPFVTSASRSIYFVLETIDAFTPAANENFTVRFWADLN